MIAALSVLPAAGVGLNGRLQLVAILVTTLLFAVVFEMVRRRHLMERYSLLWLFASAALLLLAVFTGLLTALSDAVGIATPSNALFAAAIGFMILLLLHFSATISRLTDQTKILAQRLAIAEEKLGRKDDGDS
ncbi:MAG: DUF2304 domain-containing protein [Actinobacteria bacterium]|nr:DUF2304 domain-containing protein [Actinomycetota bacterium]